MMTGRVMGERRHASRRDLSTLTPMMERRMTQHITCLHCPEEFTGSGMWGGYARHLKTEHR